MTTQHTLETSADPTTGISAVRTTWEIDPAHTDVGFAVKHLMISTVRGRFAGVRGTIQLDESDLAGSSVQVEIDAARAQLKPITGKEQLSQPVRTVYERLTNSPDQEARPRMFVDVFWCDGDELADVRRVRASELAAALATYGRFSGNDLPTVLHRVRVRQLTADVNVTTNYMIRCDVVRFNAENPDEEKWAQRIRDVALSALRLEYQKRGAENSIGVYMCSDVRIDARPSRVYFQIASIEQQGGTTSAIRQLKQDVPGLSVATGLDLQEKNSPDSTEVRYFYKEDERTAALVAERLSAITSQPVSSKRLEGKVVPGTLEVWMGKTADLARVTGQ